MTHNSEIELTFDVEAFTPSIGDIGTIPSLSSGSSSIESFVEENEKLRQLTDEDQIHKELNELDLSEYSERQKIGILKVYEDGSYDIDLDG